MRLVKKYFYFCNEKLSDKFYIMCGIVAYIGQKDAYPILINGLKRLEYRGYDSAGIGLINSDNELNIYKTKGKVSDLESFTKDKDISGTIGIAHTRWATHGEPNDVNAHPHYSRSGNIALIHNGIIENYLTLKQELISRGYEFHSSTDTEVLVNLIEEIKTTHNLDLYEATRVALNSVNGAYAIVLMEKGHPDTLIAARKGSPMVVGVGNGEYYVASDATPMIGVISDVIYVDDEEVVKIKLGEDLQIRTTTNVKMTPEIKKLQLDLQSIEKGGFEHFMLKEIYEQPNTVRDTMRGRLHPELGTVTLGGIFDYLWHLLARRSSVLLPHRGLFRDKG